jgi:hypothetical protein
VTSFLKPGATLEADDEERGEDLGDLLQKYLVKHTWAYRIVCACKKF